MLFLLFYGKLKGVISVVHRSFSFYSSHYKALSLIMAD